VLPRASSVTTGTLWTGRGGSGGRIGCGTVPLMSPLPDTARAAAHCDTEDSEEEEEE